MHFCLLWCRVMAVVLQTCMCFQEMEMILSVKNELKTLVDSVRFAVVSCPENSSGISVSSNSDSGVAISLPGKVSAGSSFVFSGDVQIGAVYSFAPVVQKTYRVIEKLANSFVAVINAIMRKQTGAVGRKAAAWRRFFCSRQHFKRQAVLACAGGLRL